MGCAGAKSKDDTSGTSVSQVIIANDKDKKDQKLLDKYVLGKVLGQGAFGVVYSCKEKQSKKEYAVKMIDQVETPLTDIQMEADMLKKLEHPCVVKLVDVYFEKVFVCIVLDLYKGGDMIEGMQFHWKNKGMLAISVIQNISKMMVESVAYLHKKNVIHRDLKGDNFLMDHKHMENPQCRIFLSDFGTVIEVKPDARLTHKCGTRTYWAPEFYSLNYSFPVDMWAIGVIMFGLVTGRFPFKGEHDVRSKEPKFPSRTTQPGEKFMGGLLHREEEKRLKAADALKEPFVSSIKSAAEQATEKMEFTPEVKEGGANVGVQERRKELVERIANAHKKQGPVTDFSKLAGGFEVKEQIGEEKTNRFAWWAANQVNQACFYDEKEASKVEDMKLVVNFADVSLQATQQMLQEHNINLEPFGKGEAKTVSDLAAEVQSGQSSFMLDARGYKQLVRVVDLVLIRVLHGIGKDKKWLVKSSETLPDRRQRSGLNQICGTKKLPHENARQTIARLMSDRLQVQDANAVKVDYAMVECLETEEMSPSYPGIKTLYRKEIYEGRLVTTNATVLKSLGLKDKSGNGQEFNVTDSKQYSRKYEWLTEAVCKQRGVMLRASKDTEISPFVHAPVGMEEPELEKLLKDHNFDISKFLETGKTLKDFSDELIRGESQIRITPDNKILRVVDVVVLVIKKKNGQTLVETEELCEGQSKALNRLPALKRRPDENPFWAAKRVQSKVLRISENLMTLDHTQCLLIQETMPSQAFGNMDTLYRRLIVPATMIEE